MHKSFSYLFEDDLEKEGIKKNFIYTPINEKGIEVVSWLKPNTDFEKTASVGLKDYSPKIQEYVGTLKQRNGWVACIISALGAYETYGFNKNGDGFKREVFIDDGVHKTYEEYGLPFKYHLNKPERGHPVYGDKVALAEFNEDMDRVELVVWYDLSRDNTLLSDIDSGNVGVSMGFKAKFDTCSICGTHATKLTDYCVHAISSIIGRIPANQLYKVKAQPHPQWRLGYIFPDGREVGRFNRYGRFHDISRVIIPAWRPGRILQKVAHSRNYSIQTPKSYDKIQLKDNGLQKVASMNSPRSFVENYLNKQSQAEKVADIYKRIPNMKEEHEDKVNEIANKCSVVGAMEQPIPTNTLNEISESAPLKKILATLLSVGIMPKPKEFQRIVLISMKKKNLADTLDNNNVDFTSVSPDFDVSEKPISFNENDIDENILSKISCHIKDRSCFFPFLHERLEKFAADTSGFPPPTTEDPSRELVPTLAALGGLYFFLKGGVAGLKPAVRKGMAIMPSEKILGERYASWIDKVFAKHPKTKLALLAATGAGLIGGMNYAMMGQPKGTYHEIDPGMTHLDYMEKLKEKNKEPFTKIGAFDPGKASGTLKKLFLSPGTGPTAVRIAAGVPALYMASGVLTGRRQRDPFYEEGKIKSFVRKHPGLSAGLLAFGPHGARMAGHELKSLFKKAESDTWKNVKSWMLWGAMMPKRVAVNVAMGAADALALSGLTKAVKAMTKAKQPKNLGGTYGNISRTM